MTVSRWLDGFVGVIVATLVVLTPLAFGSVETWAMVILETAIFAAGAAWLASRSISRSARRNTGLEIPIAIFLLLVLVQITPLPRQALRILSPRASQLYEWTMPGYGHGAEVAVGDAEGFERWLLDVDRVRSKITPARPTTGRAMPASYSVAETREALTLLCAYVLLFLLAADYFRRRSRFRAAIVWIAFVGVGIAVLGIFQKLSWNGKILWFRDPGQGTRPFGPFVNANHFAGYMELILPLAVGLLLTLLSRHAQFGYRIERDAEPERRRRGSRFAALDFFGARPDENLPWTGTSTAPKAVLLGFLIAMSLASILLSLSRGGFVATMATFAIFGRSLAPPSRARGHAARFAGVIVIAAIVVGVAFWAGSSAIAERAATLGGLKSEPSFAGRLKTWELTLDLVRDHAMLGTGLGTFQTSFLGYYPPLTYGIWRQAHNDYLQLLAEVGGAGILAALAALVIFLHRHFLAALLDRHRPDRYLTLGLAMSIVSMLVHSVVDFSLQVPAVGFLFVLIGALLVASNSPIEDDEAPRASPRSVLPLRAAAVGLLALTIAVGVAGAWRIQADRRFARARASHDRPTTLALLEQATALCPSEPGPVRALGDACIEAFDDDDRNIAARAAPGRQMLARAESSYLRAVTLEPLASWGWWGLGQVYARRSEIERFESPIDLSRLGGKMKEDDLPPAAKLSMAALRTAEVLEPNSYQIQDEMAQMLYSEGLVEPALAAHRRSFRIMPVLSLHGYPPGSQLPDDVYRAMSDGLQDALEDHDIRERSDILKESGDLAMQRRDAHNAELRYRMALEAAVTDLQREVLSERLASALIEQEKWADAEPLLVKASSGEVVGAAASLSLGNLRARRGDHQGALEAYTRAAARAPESLPSVLGIARETAATGRRDAAIQQLRDLLDTKPGARDARVLLIALLREDGDRAGALSQAEELLSLEPGSEEYKKLVEDIEGSRNSDR